MTTKKELGEIVEIANQEIDITVKAENFLSLKRSIDDRI